MKAQSKFYAISFLVVALIGLTACGSSKPQATSRTSASTVLDSQAGVCGDSKLIGAWERGGFNGTERLTLNSSCKGTSTYCAYNISFQATKATSTGAGADGTIDFSVTNSNMEDGCMPDGTYNDCTYTVDAFGLAISCPTGTLSFGKAN